MKKPQEHSFGQMVLPVPPLIMLNCTDCQSKQRQTSRLHFRDQLLQKKRQHYNSNMKQQQQLQQQLQQQQQKQEQQHQQQHHQQQHQQRPQHKVPKTEDSSNRNQLQHQHDVHFAAVTTATAITAAIAAATVAASSTAVAAVNSKLPFFFLILNVYNKFMQFGFKKLKQFRNSLVLISCSRGGHFSSNKYNKRLTGLIVTAVFCSTLIIPTTIASATKNVNKYVINETAAAAAAAASSPTAAEPPAQPKFIGCTQCHMRKQVETQSLASFKKHILRRLEMDQPPNVTARSTPQIAETVITNFYYRNGQRYKRLNGTLVQSSSGTLQQQQLSNDDRMQGDEPASAHHSNRATVINVSGGKNIDNFVQRVIKSGGSPHKHGGSAAAEQFSHQFDEMMVEYYKDGGAAAADQSEDDEEDSDYTDDEEYFSKIDSIYSFPKLLSKARHRHDILEFQIKENPNLSIYSAVFHLHIRGYEWIRENEPALLKADHNLQDTIAVSLNRLVRSSPLQQRYTRTDSDWMGKIPKGRGINVQFNVTDLVQSWLAHPQGLQEVVVKALEPWMRPLLVLDTSSQYGPYIELQTRDIRKKRTKRQIALNCNGSEDEKRCCRYPLRVDFREFGWEWIIAPDVYEAFYCSGDCQQGYLTKNPHTYISQLSSSISPCCSPRKLTPLSLLYFDENNQVIHSVIPNMAVEKCGCA